jgi:hypothetical protein
MIKNKRFPSEIGLKMTTIHDICNHLNEIKLFVNRNYNTNILYFILKTAFQIKELIKDRYINIMIWLYQNSN